MIIQNNMTPIISILKNLKNSNEGMKVSNDDMKVAKFKVLCNLVKDCLNQGRNYESTAKIYLFYGEEYKNNLFMSCVKEMCTRGECELDIRIAGLGYLISENDDISKLISRVKGLKTLKESKNVSNQSIFLDAVSKYEWDVIFWNLLAVTLDENVFETNINKIIDLAYMFEFSEAMIKDWCRAVEFVLSGDFKEDFEQLNFETAEANQYFKRCEE